MSTATTDVAALDERTLERAAKTAAAYRALADAIEADPALAPGEVGSSFSVYAPNLEGQKEYFAAARRLFPDAKVEIDGSFAKVSGKLAGIVVTFSAFASDVMVKRTTVREVEEYVLDDEDAS